MKLIEDLIVIFVIMCLILATLFLVISSFFYMRYKIVEWVHNTKELKSRIDFLNGVDKE